MCSVFRTESRGPENTINHGLVDLGQIELLVHEGFYSNRNAFIRKAIRNYIEPHAETVRGTVLHRTLALGLRRITPEELLAAQAAQAMPDFGILSLALIAPDATAELARDTISSPSVPGAIQASETVKVAMADRLI
jgi:Arc/MetJ-type ribon-helix-helix transcriptional regulator